MRIHAWTTITVVGIALLLSSCAESDTNSVAQTNEPATDAGQGAEGDGSQTVTAQKVMQEADETLDAAGDLASQTQEEYVSDLKEQLVKLDEELEELDRRADTLTDEAAADWEATWTDLQDRRQQMQERLDELQAASGGAWSDLRAGADTAWGELQLALDKARGHFEDDVGDASPSADQADAEDAPEPN